MEAGRYVLLAIGIDKSRGANVPPQPFELGRGIYICQWTDDHAEAISKWAELMECRRYRRAADVRLRFMQVTHCLLFHVDEPLSTLAFHDVIWPPTEVGADPRLSQRFLRNRQMLTTLQAIMIAAPLNFGCVEHWLGVHIEDPAGISCREAMDMGWYGRGRLREMAADFDMDVLRKAELALRGLEGCAGALNARLTVVADAFARALMAEDWRFELMGLWVAMEALFGNVTQEITHQVSERAAAFTLDPGPSRVERFKRLKKAYGVRSRVVHGTKVERPQDADVELVEDTVRASLLRVFSDENLIELFSGSQGALDEHFCQLVLAPTSAHP